MYFLLTYEMYGTIGTWVGMYKVNNYSRSVVIEYNSSEFSGRSSYYGSGRRTVEKYIFFFKNFVLCMLGKLSTLGS